MRPKFLYRLKTSVHTLHYTRWFRYDRDKLWLVYTQIVSVIFEPPCTHQLTKSIRRNNHRVMWAIRNTVIRIQIHRYECLIPFIYPDHRNKNYFQMLVYFYQTTRRHIPERQPSSNRSIQQTGLKICFNIILTATYSKWSTGRALRLIAAIHAL
jgi:hypothetical protein